MSAAKVKFRGMWHYGWDVYKTWTPGPWTTPVDPVHGPPLWPRSMDPFMDHPSF